MGSDLPPQQAWNLAAIANSLFRMYDVDQECPHGHLPSDKTISCECWMTNREAIRTEVKEAVRPLERLMEDIKRTSEAQERNLYAILQEVKASADGTRR